MAWFGCAALGAVAVTTNTRSAGEELAYYAEDCALSPRSPNRVRDLVAKSAPAVRFQVCTTTTVAGRACRRRVVRRAAG